MCDRHHTIGELGIKPITDLGVVRENKLLKERVAALENQLRAHETVITDGAITPHSEGRCQYHLSVVVDMEAPVVECATCGTELDAVEVLRSYANEERRFRYQDAAARKAYHLLTAEVRALKQQRSSLRSQIKKKGATPVGDNEYVPNQY
jgi:hypothetical protein